LVAVQHAAAEEEAWFSIGLKLYGSEQSPTNSSDQPTTTGCTLRPGRSWQSLVGRV